MDNSKKNNHKEKDSDQELRQACLHWVQCVNHKSKKEFYCAKLHRKFYDLTSNDIYELNDPFFEDILKRVISSKRRFNIITGWSTGYMKADNIETAERIISCYIDDKLFPSEDLRILRSKAYVKIAKVLKDSMPKKSIIKIVLLALKEAKEVIKIGIRNRLLLGIASITRKIGDDEMVLLTIQGIEDKKYDYLKEEHFKLLDSPKEHTLKQGEVDEMNSRAFKDWALWALLVQGYPSLKQIKLRFRYILAISRISKYNRGIKVESLEEFIDDFINNFDSPVSEKFKLIVELWEINDSFDHSKYWHDNIKKILDKIEKALKN